MRTTLRRTVLGGLLAASAAGVLAAFALGGGVASAVAGDCPSGAFTFTSTFSEQCYTVASGTSWIFVDDRRREGRIGRRTSRATGGRGPVVTGYLPVTRRSDSVCRGRSRTAPRWLDNGTGQSAYGGGGAPAAYGSGGGGGASDVRTCSIGSCTPGKLATRG